MAFALLASCAKNETTGNSGIDERAIDVNSISFQATTGSRAAISNLDNLKGLTNGFEVIGISNYGDANGTAASLFGDNDGAFKNNYKFTNPKWDWVDGTGKEWPTVEKYPLRFIAAHPFQTGLTWNNTEFEITPEPLIENQVDLLVANATATTKPATGIMPLDFKHALTALQVQVLSSANYVVNIKEVSFHTLDEIKKYNYATQTWSNLADDKQVKTYYNYFQSTAVESVQALTFPATDPVAQEVVSGNYSTTAATTGVGPLMIIPQDRYGADPAHFKTAYEAWVAGGKTGDFPDARAQEVLAGGIYMQVIYNMTDGTDYVVGAPGKYIRVFYPIHIPMPSGKGWNAGKRYTYTIHLGTPDASNGTVMDPDYSTEDPTTPGGGGDLPDGVEPGNPVSKGNITFTVGVDEWAEGTNGGPSDIK